MSQKSCYTLSPLKPCPSYEMTLGPPISLSKERHCFYKNSAVLQQGAAVLLELLLCISLAVPTDKDVNLMASQKQRDLLSSGKTLWNRWRHAYPDVQAV